MTHHRVDDEDDVVGLRQRLDLFELAHQLVVDRQAAGGVEDDDVALPLFGLLDRHLAELGRRHSFFMKEADVEALGEGAQLLDGGGAIDVSTHEQGAVLLLFQHRRELARRRRFTGALQTDHHDRADGLAQAQARVDGTHQIDELFVAGLDEVLGGPEFDLLALFVAALDDDGAADRLFLHAREEAFDDAEFDVGLEQTQADFAQRLVGIRLGELGLSGEEVAGVSEAFADGLKHPRAIATTAPSDERVPPTSARSEQPRAAVRAGLTVLRRDDDPANGADDG